MTRDDAGFSATILLAIVATMALAIGGISSDLWRVVARHRELAGWVDSAAAAGATAIDETSLYASETPRLDRSAAVDRTCDALSRLSRGEVICADPRVDLDVGVDAVSLSTRRSVRLGLLALLVPGGEVRVEVGASADVAVLRGVGP